MALNKDGSTGYKWGRLCCIASVISIIRSATYLTVVILSAYNLGSITKMTGLLVIPDNVLIGLIITVAVTSLIFGVFWAIRSYTEYNNKHMENRESNPYKLNYAVGTAVAVGLSGLFTFGATVLIINKALGPEAETWVYCIAAGILAFIITGFIVKAVHMGIETACKWLKQGVKEAATNTADLINELAQYKTMMAESMAQVKNLTDQNAALVEKINELTPNQ